MNDRILAHIKTLIKHGFLLFYLHELLMSFWNICSQWILLSKILIYLDSRTFYPSAHCFALKVDRSYVNPGICLIRPGVLRIFVYLHQIVSSRYRIKWYIFSISLTACFYYDYTDSWVDVNLTAKNYTKINFSADKIYYNFSQEYSLTTNM